MSAHELDFLADQTEETSTRFVTFIGGSMRRFDLALTATTRFYGKTLVTDLQSGLTAILGQDDLEEEGYLEHFYRLTDEEAADLRQFLSLVVGAAHFTD